MSKLNSLILLIKSLSKSEKKAFVLQSKAEEQSVYLELFHLIDKEKYPSSESVTLRFQTKYPDSVLTSHVKYLFDMVLQVLVHLNARKNKDYELYQSYLKTKVLQERDLPEDYLSLVNQTKEKARERGAYNLLLTLQREELMAFFDHIQEENELYEKQKEINENLKTIRQINEQSFLYEMLRHKIEKQKSTETDKPYIYNDLLISEMTLVSGLKNEVFEISRLHQLFQASYLINIGSYKSALHAFSELSRLYLTHQQRWNNPPVEYVMTLEGILESLNRLKLFEAMEPYKEQLSELARRYPTTHFVLKIRVLLFLYEASYLIHQEKYKECLVLIQSYQEPLMEKLFWLPPTQFLSLSICVSGIYLRNKDLAKAKKTLAPIIRSHAFSNLKLFRSVQLLYLIIYYELNDTDYLETTIRSIKRKNRMEKKETQVERLLFRYLETEWKILPARKRQTLKLKFETEITTLKYSVDDLQLCRYFDFPGWMLKKLK